MEDNKLEEKLNFAPKNDTEESNGKHVMGPLLFAATSSSENRDKDDKISCMFCDKLFANTEVKNDPLLHHMLNDHQLIISQVSQVCDFRRYCQHWKKRFKEEPITEFCSVININSKPSDIGPKVQYYLLCDALPEDRELREKLQQIRLEKVLESQQRERSDTHFSRTCLFCKQHFEENRSLLFSHMAEDHGFSVGQPDNIVYVNEFLDQLEKTLKNLQCIFCDKKFKDRQTLKDHMRKKQHKKINPKNKDYDRFYIINYLELGKTWEEIQKEEDEEEPEDQTNENENWSDWTEPPEPTVCLFCHFTSTAITDLLQHMKDVHQFDLMELKNSLGLDFYGQVKIVNFIRKRVFDVTCIYCQEKCQSSDALLDHQTSKQHFKLPEDKTVWDQPQYYFSTYENDGLLCCLEDDDEEDDDEEDDEDENKNQTKELNENQIPREEKVDKNGNAEEASKES
uniref:Zinc finger protein 277-like n=1 Tax=Actinia tenebrosa TaxID=6105 RepID=A0A6P8IY14_ACTTE